MADSDDETGPDNAPETGRDPAGGPAFAGKIIANLLELTERRLQQLVNEGWIPRPMRGQYSLTHSVRGYIRYLKHNQKEKQRGASAARLASAQAVKVEMENFRRMGELQVTAQVDETMQGLVVLMKSSHEGLPGRLASELAAITEPPKIYQRLQGELRVVLGQCVAYLEKRAEALEAMPEPSNYAAAVGETEAIDLGEDE